MTEPSRAELKYLVDRQQEEIRTLNEVGKLLGASPDPRELIRLVASYLHTAFPIALCGVLYLPQRKLHLFPFAPLTEMELHQLVQQIREAGSEQCQRPITEEESVCVSDPAPGGSWVQPIAALRSHLFAPMAVKGQVVGLLCVFSGQTGAFSAVDAHAVGVVADQLAAALRNASLVQDLQRADELKNQVLSIVSHELSTPLTAVKEGVSLVLDGSLGATTPDQRDFLGTVLQNTERLERLLQKVKTATEIMTSQVRLNFESLDLRTVLANLEKTHRPLAEIGHVTLRITEPTKPCFWPIDKAHLTQAIGELVENAIQATPPDGFVMVRLAVSPVEAEIQISDTGKGIAKEALPTLFERFQSIGEIHERKMGGLGLGLFLSKSLVTLHQGTIEVDTTHGVGTAMTIRLPKLSQPPAA